MKLTLIVALLSMIGLLAWATQTVHPKDAGPETIGILAYSPDGTPVPNAHMVVGSLTSGVPPGTTVTFNGPAAFTSVDTYQCFISTPMPGPVMSNLTKVDGSHIRVPGGTGIPPFKIGFQCVGN